MKKVVLLFFVILCAGNQLFGQNPFATELATAAQKLTNDKVIYDPSYFSIDYPMGDVPAGKGVCTDVVIRAYRQLNIDLQQLVHEDMKDNFSEYPTIWGLKKPDPNIDHRRVPNLQTFFTRKNASLPVTKTGSDYLPGDIVAWNLGGAVTHIGVVVSKKVQDEDCYYIVHNIGNGQELADCLFLYRIIGHYRFQP
ncbi:MAG: DUF1287 domain-containing protein [Cyclobacteriaceae bacterium]